MNAVVLLLKIAATAYVAWTIYDGTTWVTFRVRGDSMVEAPQPLHRNEFPVTFWIFTAIKCVCLTVMWWRL